MFAIKSDGLIYSSGRDLSYFPKSIHHLVVTEENVLNFGQDRLLQIYNANAEIPLQSFRDHVDAQERVAKLLLNFKLQEIPMAKRDKNTEATETTKTEAAKTEAAPKAERAGRINKSAVIRLKTDKNPKREGSSAHTRFAHYKDGITVGEFVEAGGTMGDINFDMGKGFIELEGNDAPAPVAEVAAAGTEAGAAAAE